MNKILIIVLAIIILAILLYILAITFLPFWHKPVFNAPLQKICQDGNEKTIGVWKDKNGNIKYFYSPTIAWSDGVVYLYDLSGNIIVKAGGFAPILENQKKYYDLTNNLVSSEYGSCW